jgi:hypothetical protein
MPAPCCYVCLTGDVAVKVTDELGFDHWFCAADWAAQQELSEKIRAMLSDAVRALEQG